MRIFFSCLLILASMYACKNDRPTQSTEVVEIPGDRTYIHMAQSEILIDGQGADSAWSALEWRDMNHLWLGNQPSPKDYSGRYKITYDGSHLYVLAEITDDKLVDTHPNGLEKYWDDDCLEVFIDENGSGGNHQYDYNAFAYHLSLDGRSVDIAKDSSFTYFDPHVTYKRTTTGNVSVWECAFKIFKDDYVDMQTSVPLFLKPGKQMGFMVAYCDNDTSSERENFMGSIPMTGPEKNLGWITADVFEKVVLGYE